MLDTSKTHSSINSTYYRAQEYFSCSLSTEQLASSQIIWSAHAVQPEYPVVECIALWVTSPIRLRMQLGQWFARSCHTADPSSLPLLRCNAHAHMAVALALLLHHDELASG